MAEISNGKATKAYLYTSLPIDQRVSNLLSLMTWEEKVLQLGAYLHITDWNEWMKLNKHERVFQIQSLSVAEIVGDGIGQVSMFLRDLPSREAAEKANEIQHHAREHTRLGIPPIIHDEGLHGLIGNNTTIFPQAIAMASSWDPDLLGQIAEAVGIEARTRGIRQLLSPTINIARDPRCGRTQETYGEDPYLTSRLAVEFVRALQNQGIIATPKHFVANFVGDGGRDSNAVHLSERILREIYLPAFEAAVREGGSLSIMAAYNSLDGIPCSCNKWLLTDLLRGEWGFDGYVVSDYESVKHIMEKHGVATNRLEAGKRAVEAGLDVELPTTVCYGDPLLDGIGNKAISHDAVNEAVRRILKVKFRLGLFDDPFVDPDRAQSVNHCEEHRALALQMAREAIVLLRNEAGVLPLASDTDSIAVIGPLADEPELGDYTWDRFESEQIVSTLQGIRMRAVGATIRYAQGCRITGDSREGFEEAIRIARQSQVALICVGNSNATEGEQRDRADLRLPGVQANLIQAIAETGRPTIVFLINGSPILMSDWIEEVAAVVEAWYPGESGGTAIAEILFGDTNPSGKLPISIPRAMGQLPLYYNYKPSGRIYNYIDLSGAPLYPFGYGLSYTTFTYRNLRISPVKAESHETIIVSLEVENTGDRTGDEVVQVYVHDKIASVTRPVKELKSFRRITLKSKESQQVSFKIDIQLLGLYDANLQYIVEPGEFEVMVGSSSEDIRLIGEFEVIPHSKPN